MKISLIKSLFLMRQMREKLFLLALFLLLVVLWGSGFGERLQVILRSHQETNSELVTQSLWLGRKDQIEAEAAKSIERLDSAKTLDGIKLLAEVNRIANEVGLTTNVQADDARDESSTQFTVHSLRYTVRKAQYPVLVRFYQELQKRSPYIGIEQFSLKAESDGRLLTALFRLSSVEVKK